MSKLYMRKNLGSLHPMDAAGEDALRKLKNGEDVQVEIKRPRNIKHHRKFFALVNLVFENQDHYQSVDHLLVALKVALGHCDTVILKNGGVGYIPKSIAFHKMDQSQFEEFYDRTCDIIAKHFLPGVTSDNLKAEVESLIGIRSAA